MSRSSTFHNRVLLWSLLFGVVRNRLLFTMDYFCPSPRTMMKNIKTIIFLLHVYQQKIHTTQTSGSVVSAFCTHYRPVSSSSSSFPLRVSDETRPAEVTTGISLPVDDNERGSTAAAAVANGGKITVDDIAVS